MDMDEIIANQTPREMNPYVQLILDNAVASTMRYWLELGTDKLLYYLARKQYHQKNKKLGNL